jgi:hypothetical protein
MHAVLCWRNYHVTPSLFLITEIEKLLNVSKVISDSDLCEYFQE